MPRPIRSWSSGLFDGWLEPADQNLRVGDAEREAAATRLGAHLTAGRLQWHEYDERLTAAYSARTRGDLTTLFTDLPDGAPDLTVPARPAARRRSRPRGVWSLALMLLVGLLRLGLLITVLAVGLVLRVVGTLVLLMVAGPGGQRARHGGWHGGCGSRRSRGPSQQARSRPATTFWDEGARWAVDYGRARWQASGASRGASRA